MKIIIFTLAEDRSDAVIQNALSRIGDILECDHINGTILNEKDLINISVIKAVKAETADFKKLRLAEMINSVNQDYPIISKIAFNGKSFNADPAQVQANIWKSLTSKSVNSLHITRLRRFVTTIEALQKPENAGYGESIRQNLSSDSEFHMIYDICKTIIS